MRSDPRIRQTWNDISQNLDAANQSAQANVFTFSQEYVQPCLSSLSGSAQLCLGSCFPPPEERLRRSRARRRGRAENSFDFYDDWEDDGDAGDAFLGWGNDELDQLLAGSGARGGSAEQPNRPRTMSYGARRGGDGRYPDGAQDPLVIPKSSVFGFLGRLPWKIGKELRYKPSAADLQDRPGKGRRDAADEPLLQDGDEGEVRGKKGKDRRVRSSTTASDTTTESFRSRRDLFPSDDEDDAIPLDDEFAMVLERRTTGSGADENSSRASRKKSSRSRQSTRSDSSRETRHSSTPAADSAGIDAALLSADGDVGAVPPMAEFKEEEESIKRAEEIEVEKKREAARKLARSRGLSVTETLGGPPEESKSITEALNPSPEPPSDFRQTPAPDPPNPSQGTSFVPAQLPHFEPSTGNESSES